MLFQQFATNLDHNNSQIVTLLQLDRELREARGRRERERGREREVGRVEQYAGRLMAPSKTHQENINNIPLKIHYPLWQASRTSASTSTAEPSHQSPWQPTNQRKQQTKPLHTLCRSLIDNLIIITPPQPTTAVRKGSTGQQKPGVRKPEGGGIPEISQNSG